MILMCVLVEVFLRIRHGVCEKEYNQTRGNKVSRDRKDDRDD